MLRLAGTAIAREAYLTNLHKRQRTQVGISLNNFKAMKNPKHRGLPEQRQN